MKGHPHPPLSLLLLLSFCKIWQPQLQTWTWRLQRVVLVTVGPESSEASAWAERTNISPFKSFKGFNDFFLLTFSFIFPTLNSSVVVQTWSSVSSDSWCLAPSPPCMCLSLVQSTSLYCILSYAPLATRFPSPNSIAEELLHSFV